MQKNTRIVVRNLGKGWVRVTVDNNTTRMRNTDDVLVRVADAAKAKGAQGVSWGATSATQWVGFTF